MEIRVQILAITGSIALMLVVIHLIRRRTLRAEYGILWLLGTVALLVISIWRGLLDRIAALIGVYYAPAVLLLVGIFFGILAFLHLTVVLSKQSDKSKRLAQDLALLRERLESLEKHPPTS